MISHSTIYRNNVTSYDNMFSPHIVAKSAQSFEPSLENSGSEKFLECDVISKNRRNCATSCDIVFSRYKIISKPLRPTISTSKIYFSFNVSDFLRICQFVAFPQISPQQKPQSLKGVHCPVYRS